MNSWSHNRIQDTTATESKMASQHPEVLSQLTACFCLTMTLNALLASAFGARLRALAHGTDGSSGGS